jgi:putative ABC transport system substrate-binding protein
MISGDDPVRSGFVASLARPGGNVTGLTILARDLVVKRLEFLKTAVPGVSRIAVLGNFGSQTSSEQLGEARAVAGSLHVQLIVAEVRGAGQLDDAFVLIAKERPGALLVFTDPTLFLNRRRIGDFARQQLLPMASDWRETAEAGALIAYGPSFQSLARQTAQFIDKIFTGTRPADLPVEQPTQFPLVINMKVAKALGLSIPEALLLRADELIE